LARNLYASIKRYEGEGYAGTYRAASINDVLESPIRANGVSRMKLRHEVADRIVVRLMGTYGQQFAGKFSRKENGIDVGVEMFKESISVELGGFSDNLEAIAYALNNLPADHVPNAIQLRELARKAPKKEVPAIAYTPSPEDEAKAKAAIKKAADELKPKISDGIDRHWATHPRSAMHMKFIFDAAKNDSRFHPCIAELVADGICTEDGHLIKRYSNGSFVKA
jgi:hypothetical protein